MRYCCHLLSYDSHQTELVTLVLGFSFTTTFKVNVLSTYSLLISFRCYLEFELLSSTHTCPNLVNTNTLLLYIAAIKFFLYRKKQL
jgi:hypothetical protein